MSLETDPIEDAHGALETNAEHGAFELSDDAQTDEPTLAERMEAAESAPRSAPPSVGAPPMTAAEAGQRRAQAVKLGAVGAVALVVIGLIGLYFADLLRSTSASPSPTTVEPFLTWDEIGAGNDRVEAPALRSGAFRTSQPAVVLGDTGPARRVAPAAAVLAAPPKIDTSEIKRACGMMNLSSIVQGEKPMALLDGKIVRKGDYVIAGSTGIRLIVNKIAADHIVLAWKSVDSFRIDLKR